MIQKMTKVKKILIHQKNKYKFKKKEYKALKFLLIKLKA